MVAMSSRVDVSFHASARRNAQQVSFALSIICAHSRQPLNGTSIRDVAEQSDLANDYITNGDELCLHKHEATQDEVLEQK